MESLEPYDRYVKLQWEVGVDARLKHLDVRLLFILKGCQHNENKPVDVGRRRLAMYANASQRAVADSIDRLVEYGWVEVSGGRRGERAMYATKEVKFNLAGEKMAEVSANLRGPVEKGSARPPTKKDLIRCPVCGVLCRQILRFGWCRKCNWKREIRNIVDERIQEKSA